MHFLPPIRFAQDSLVSQQNSQIPEVIPGRSRLDHIANLFEQRIRVEFLNGGANVESAYASTIKSAPIHERACRRTISIHSVCARAEHGNILPDDFLGAGQRELLIAPAHPGIRNPYRHLSSGD